MFIQQELIKEDLYQAVNGDWLAQAEIPSDQVSTGGFISVRDDIEELMMGEVAGMAQGEIKVDNPEMQEFVKYYQMASDFQARDELAAQPVQKVIQALQSMENFDDFNSQAKDMILAQRSLPFNFGISPDMKDTDHYALYLGSPAIILPDKTYYGTDQGDQLLAVFQDMMVELLDLMGLESPDQWVKDALAFDALLAPHVKSSEEEADYTKNYNPRTVEEVAAYSGLIDFEGIIQDIIGHEVDQVIVTDPDFYGHYADIVTEDNFTAMKAWILVLSLYQVSGLLSEEIRQVASRYDLALSGKDEAQSKEKHAYYTAIGRFDQPVGIYYGKKYFGPEARQDVEDMIDEMIEIYKQRLASNTWLSQATIDQAIVKLDALEPLIGYPETYPSLYKSYQVDETASFFDNQQAFSRLEQAFELARWGQKVDRREWGMSAATVNAYFNPMSNVICFPAAILQAPFYSLDQSRSENFGGIGAVIAHEISHAFDNNGAYFDEKGNMENWWTDDDFKTFNAKAKAMVDLFDGLETEVGKVNGRLTVSENIADQGGLRVAYEAMTAAPDADPQAFFINWARIWCQKARPEYQELLLRVDVHSPAKLRANVQVQLIDGFYEAFDVKSGDPMYLAPEDRVVIW